MRIFVSEFICSGALSGQPLPESLQHEGLAMLLAITSDLNSVTDCQIVTTLDSRIVKRSPYKLGDRCQIRIVRTPDEEHQIFDEFTRHSDTVLVIAPETDGVLATRIRRVQSLGGRSLNCSAEAVELCGDKLRLAEHLKHHAIPTIPTCLTDFLANEPADLFPAADQSDQHTGWIVKPRDGAGSWLTFHIPHGSRNRWREVESIYKSARVERKALLQPFLVGQALSVGCLCHSDGDVEIFPIGKQHLSTEFQYLGGSIPAELPANTIKSIEQIVHRAYTTIPGMRGYIGIDLLVPKADPPHPVVVEINPRLTTSYVGYRQLCEENIACHWLDSFRSNSHGSLRRLRWKPQSIHFNALGSQ